MPISCKKAAFLYNFFYGFTFYTKPIILNPILKPPMKKTIINCLRKICCNFCFMLLGTFSKAEISSITVLKANGNLIEIKNSAFNDKICNKKSGNKKALLSLPKKRKKIAKQSEFEIRELPKGQYTPQLDHTNSIFIKKTIFIIK